MFPVLFSLALLVHNWGYDMESIKDYNNDGDINWKDYVFYSLTIAGNIILTIINVLH